MTEHYTLQYPRPGFVASYQNGSYFCLCCMFVWVDVCTYAYGDSRSTSAVTSQALPSLYFETGSLTEV